MVAILAGRGSRSVQELGTTLRSAHADGLDCRTKGLGSGIRARSGVSISRAAADVHDDLGVARTGGDHTEHPFTPPLRCRAGDHGLPVGHDLRDGLSVDFQHHVTRLEAAPAIGRDCRNDQLALDPIPRERRECSLLRRAGPANVAMAVVQRCHQNAQCPDEGAFVGVLSRVDQCPPQFARPVDLYNVEIRIEVLKDVPGDHNRGQPGGAVIPARLEAGRPGRDDRSGLRWLSRIGPRQGALLVRFERTWHDARYTSAEVRSIRLVNIGEW